MDHNNVIRRWEEFDNRCQQQASYTGELTEWWIPGGSREVVETRYRDEGTR